MANRLYAYLPMSRPIYLPPTLAERPGLIGRLERRLYQLRNAVGGALVRRGLPPALLGSRFRRSVLAEQAASQVLVVHPAERHCAPLATGFAQTDDLPEDAGWWGFSFRDVPYRRLSPTRILTIPNARVLTTRAGPDGAYAPAVLDRSGRTLDLREIKYRPFHAPLSTRVPDLVLDQALWIAERVFDNYSHWLTAHLPKLVLLRDRGELANLVLPANRPQWLDRSLDRIGIRESDFHELPSEDVLAAGRLRLVECDRFRPELLSAAREALNVNAAPAERSRQRVFISRRKARGRALIAEAELEPLLLAAGFELIAMEGLTLDEQIALMSGAEVLLAPHGAGLVNMLFCRPGTIIGEIADPAYPNPNFYAMAAALGHRFHYITAHGVGDRHPLRQDLSVNPVDVRAFLHTLG